VIRKKLRILIRAIILIALILSSILYFLYVKKKDATTLMNRFPKDSSIGVVHLKEIFQLISQNNELVSSTDSLAHFPWIKLLKKPLLSGIDPLVDPVVCLHKNYWACAFVVNDQKKWKTWVEESVGALYPLHFFPQPNFDQWIIDSNFCISSDKKGNCLLVFKRQEAFPFNEFFQPSITLDRASNFSGNGLVEIEINEYAPALLQNKWLSPVARGIIRLYADRQKLQVKMGIDQSFQNVNQLSFHVLETDKLSEPISLLSQVWKIDSSYNQRSMLQGHWLFEWTGIDSISKTFITYEFDDNFEKQEIKRTQSEMIPQLHINFRPKSRMEEELIDHWQSNNLVVKEKNPKVKFGSYSLFFRSDESGINMSTDTVFSSNLKEIKAGYLLNVFPSRLTRDFEILGLALPEKLASFGTFDQICFYNSEKGYLLEIQSTNNEKHVISMLLEALNPILQ
jgi:hypothetical protein